jgi:hypothetical protein
MISKDESIVTQVAAKIASELTCKTECDGNLENIQSAYLAHFDFVRELLVGTHGFNEVVAVTNSPKVSTETNRVNDIAESFDASYTQGSGVQIKGKQHGPIPAWLVTACAKANVTTVYDNRDTSTAENRRPLFKAVDGNMDAKGQPLAFWAPSPKR